MNFIHPNILGPEMDALRAVFKTKGDSKVALLAKNRVTRAKRMMTPFVLRRRKDQVLKDLPRKIERIEWCDMTPLQRKLYDEAVARSRKTALEVPTPEEAASTSKKKKAPSKAKEKKYLENSSNVLMDLRKASSHPMLFRVKFDDAVLGKICRLLVKEDDYRKFQWGEVFEELSYWPDMELQRTCYTYKVCLTTSASDILKLIPLAGTCSVHPYTRLLVHLRQSDGSSQPHRAVQERRSQASGVLTGMPDTLTVQNPS